MSSYKVETSDYSDFFQSYKKDFKKPGDFWEEETTTGKIKFLEYWLPLGNWTGKSWKISGNNDYSFRLIYKNKNHIIVRINATDWGTHSNQNRQKSFDFLKKIAKEFYLINHIILRKQRMWDASDSTSISIEDSMWHERGNTNTPWEYVLKLIEESKDIETANSWSKIMTMEEIEELLKALKVKKVKFPE
ncbi:MAG: hypothetical protein WDK96_03180 [Candidatus Paceibacterota bacterium]|jgi:hypothetical protein